jgi:hypothetical protein
MWWLKRRWGLGAEPASNCTRFIGSLLFGRGVAARDEGGPIGLRWYSRAAAHLYVKYYSVRNKYNATTITLILAASLVCLVL